MKIGVKLSTKIYETKRFVLINLETKMRLLMKGKNEMESQDLIWEMSEEEFLSRQTKSNVMKSNTFNYIKTDVQI